MADKKDEPTKAEMLAALVTGNASISSTMATVQRSHRFPLHLFTQIENMARMGDVPVSVIINELLECGIDAVLRELPEQAAREASRVTRDQMERPSITETIAVKGRNLVRKLSKSGRSK